MAIDDVKQSIIENVTNAYNTVDAKGGAITGAKNLENLSDSIDSIVTGTVVGYHVRSVINDDGETQTLKISAGKLPEGELSITENGRYDVADYAEAVVDVPSEEPVLIDKTITENGEYSASADGADGYSNVSVSVAGLIPSGTLSVSANGIYDVTNYASADVNIAVEGGGGMAMALNYGVSEIIDTNGEVTSIRDYAFNYNRSLMSVTFPACTSIHSRAFTYCEKLKSVNMPNCSIIGEGAFTGCYSLSTGINMPGLKLIESNAFQYCSGLKDIYFTAESIYSYAFRYCSNITTISLPNCKRLGAVVFDTSKVTSLDLPEVTSIDNAAINQMSNLASFSFPKLRMCQGLFTNNSHITSVYLPELTTCDMAFIASCRNLTTIDLPKCVNFGGANNCSALTSVSLPACTKFTGGFGGCIALSQISLPVCSSFSGYAFNSCSALTSVYAPKLEYLSASAFHSCVALP